MRKLLIGLSISMLATVPASAKADWHDSEGGNCPKRRIEFTDDHARTVEKLHDGQFGTIIDIVHGPKTYPYVSYLVAPNSDLKFAYHWIIYMDEGDDGSFEWISTFCPIS